MVVDQMTELENTCQKELVEECWRMLETPSMEMQTQKQSFSITSKMEMELTLRQRVTEMAFSPMELTFLELLFQTLEKPSTSVLLTWVGLIQIMATV